MKTDVVKSVRERAQGRCEYCRMPERFDDLPFQVEHIIARQHGGEDAVSNLAVACVACNLYKGPNLSAIDPVTGKIVRLFDPRRQKWNRHFQLDGGFIEGKTLTGRATVRLLQFNLDLRVALRLSLIAIDKF